MSLVRPLVVSLVVGAIAVACDPVPTAIPTGPASPPREATVSGVSTGLVACPQSYDSTTRVIGPRGGSLAVGSYTLYVDSLVLAAPVTITAVAPAGNVRWVRFRPDGLLFPPNVVDGWGAILYTRYKGCGLPTTANPRIAQVSDALGILTYLQTSLKVTQTSATLGNQYVAGLLPHFSNYAVAW